MEKEPYWRDVGTVDAFWQANIDLTDFTPELDLYDNTWPIWTYSELTAPAKFIHNEEGRRGIGVVLDGVRGVYHFGIAAEPLHAVYRCAHPFVFQASNGVVAMPYAEIGRNAHLTNVVIDRGVVIPEGLGCR